MKVTTEKLEGSRVCLEIESPASVVDEGLDKAYKAIVRRVNIPGFRRGKAPRHIVERFYKEGLFEEAQREVLPQEYLKAVEETKIEPIDQPEYSDITFERGQPLKFKATVYVQPEVELGDYRSLSKPFESPTVSDEDVDNQIPYIRERLAEIRPLPEDASLDAGNFTTCHVTGIDGGDFKVDIDQDLTYLEVGREFGIVPGLGEALIGMKKGETKEFVGTYPGKAPDDSAKEETTETSGDTPAESEAPKSAKFKVEVKELYEKHVPDDEELLKALGKKTMEEAREDIRQRLMEVRLDNARRKHTEEVEKALLDMATVEIPTVLVDRKAEDLLQNFLERLQNSGTTVESYMQSTGKTPEDINNEIREQAEIDVKRDLVLDEVTRREETQVPQEAIDRVLAALANQVRQDIDTVRTTLEVRGAYEGIKNDLARMESLKKVAILAADNAGTPLPLEESSEKETNDKSNEVERESEATEDSTQPAEETEQTE